MRDSSLFDGRCICGKVKFESVSKAKQFDPSKRIYFCGQSSTYHLTSKKKWDTHRPPPASAQFSIRKLQKELNVMATMQDYIKDYMREQYKKNKQYKFTSSEVINGVLKKSSTYSKSTISAQISTLKTRGVIEDLGEQVPGGRQNSKYFTLPELLEEVTKPTTELVAKKEEEPVSTKSPISTKLPSQTTPSNPFDKVNSQLGELLQKVNGLSSGYAVIAEALSGGTPVAKTDNEEVLKLLKTISDAVAKPVVVDHEIADAINSRLGDLSKPDSFIYMVRENVIEEMHRLDTLITNTVGNLSAPENYGSLSDDEKYRTGIKEGIRLAVEMGLKLD